MENLLPCPAHVPDAAILSANERGGELPRLAEGQRIGVGNPAVWLFAADVLGIALIAASVWFWLCRFNGSPLPMVTGLCLFLLCWTAGAQMVGIYRRDAMQNSLRMQLGRALTVFALGVSGVLSIGFAAGALDAAPRRAVLVSAAGAAAWVMLTRLGKRLIWQRLLSLGYCVERALVLADTLPAARRLAGMIDAESTGGLGIAGCAALPALGDVPALDWIEAHARSGAVDRVVLCADPAAMPRVNAVLTRLARLTIDVSILPDLGGLTAPVLKVDRIGTLPAVELDFRPLTRWQMMLKRAEDLVLAGLVTVFILPVLAVIAIAIKLDSPGPVLFRQPRAGFHDRVFNLWKFRTMHAHARDERAVHQTERNDPRVTRVGRILRRTSLDELPQLFNVLAGSMSIVGPRPHALGMTADGAALHDVIEDYSARHRLKPGITGWAQVNGCRGEIRTHEKLRRRVALDCYYIENWSLRLDLWIMARTAAKILNDSDAY